MANHHGVGLAALIVAALLASCSEESAPGNAPSAGGASGAGGSGAAAGAAPCGPPSPEARAQNQVIFEGLKPTCEGCHVSGARGYFASIEAFESLLVYNPKEVVPGDPDQSELVRLLEGKGKLAFKQMPPAGPLYSELVAQGVTTLTVAQVREWVKGLKASSADARPSPKARRISRLGPTEVLRALYQQLGLSDADFFTPASEYGLAKKNPKSDDLYPVSPALAVPAPYDDLSPARFATLGGGTRPDSSITPSFVGSLAQISQRWCKLALDKPDNTALLPKGASLGVGASQPDQVKAVIRAWFLHFHAVQATDAEVNEVFDGVFSPLEQGKDSRTAYVGTCSYFIRHPDWVFY